MRSTGAALRVLCVLFAGNYDAAAPVALYAVRIYK